MSTQGKRIRRWVTAEVYSERFFDDGNWAEFQTHGVKVNEFEATVQRRRGGRWGRIRGKGYEFLATPWFTIELDWPSGERALGPNVEYTGDAPRDGEIEAIHERLRHYYDTHSTVDEMHGGRRER
jgi:hypothetical protein